MTQISRLALGTASFGMAYPPGSGSPRPTGAESAAMLRHAYERGVRWFDTGAAYGDAEVRVDDAFRGSPRFYTTTTKVAADIFECGYWRRSRPVWTHILVHNPVLADFDPASILMKFHADLQALSGPGCGIDGASVYTPAEAHAAIAAGLRIIQVQYHALDQSHAKAGVFEAARAAGVTVMARQPWCRGLLLLPRGRLTILPLLRLGFDGADVVNMANAISQFQFVCDRHAISYVEAGLRFSLESLADVVVFGVSSMAQLQQDLDIAASVPPLAWAACYAELLATFADAGVTLASVCTPEVK